MVIGQIRQTPSDGPQNSSYVVEVILNEDTNITVEWFTQGSSRYQKKSIPPMTGDL